MIEWLANLYQSFVVTLLWLSVVAALVALVVMIVRRLLKGRIPHRTLCVLWLLVFLRLFLPVTIETPFSLIPSPITNAVQQNFVTEELSGEPVTEPDDTPTMTIPEAPQVSPAPVVSAPVVDAPQMPAVSAPVTQAPQQSAPVVQPSSAPGTEDADPIEDEEKPVMTDAQKKAQLRQAIAAGIWLIGVAAMLVSGAVSYLMLRRRVYDSIRAADGVWEHPDLSSPFILGLFRPRIYLPMGIDGQARQFILQHERAHLHRLDHIVKPICWLALAFHWFNPFVWGAFQLMGRDIENACDERVIRTLGNEVKADYAATLLALATKKRFPAPSPLSFNEGDAEARIKNVLRFKKPVLWVSIGALVIVLIASVCLLSNRSPRSLNSYYPQVNWGKVESTKASFRLSDYPMDYEQIELTDAETAEVIDLLHEYKYWKELSHLIPDNRIGWYDLLWGLYFDFENGSQLSLTYSESGTLVASYRSGLLPDGSALGRSEIHCSIDGEDALTQAVLAVVDRGVHRDYTTGLRESMENVDAHSEELSALLAALIPVNVEFSPEDPLTADDCTAIFAQSVRQSNLVKRLTGIQPSSTDNYYIPLQYIEVLLSEFLIYNEKNINWEEYSHLHSEYDFYYMDLHRIPLLSRLSDQRELLQSSVVENITPYSNTELAMLMDKLDVSYENAKAYDITALFSYSGDVPVRCTYCVLFHDDSFKIVSASCESDGLDDDPVNDPVDGPVDNPAPISELGELFLSALNDEVKIVDPGLGMSDTLSVLLEATTPTVELNVTRISAVDLDGDGTKELLLELETAPDALYGTMILRYDSSDGQLFGYVLWARAFMDIKTDGTFSYSGGFATNGAARLSFTSEGYEKHILLHQDFDLDLNGETNDYYYYVNGETTTEQEFYDAFAAQREKPGVTWMEYTPENAELLLRGGFTGGEQETLPYISRFLADLTHDGVRETITLTYREDWQTYYLTVESAEGEMLWQREAGLSHVGWAGFYLYEKDRKQYLMSWSPYGNTGTFSYMYEIFSLSETGEQIPFTKGSFWYGTNTVEETLSIDVERLKAFEAEVNALLEDTIVLIDTNEGMPYYSTQNATLCKLWAAPIKEVQEWKQSVIDRLPLVMAYMELEPTLLASVEEQVAIHMGDYDLAYVEQVKDIGQSAYRVTFKPGDYDGVSRVTWQDSRYFDIVKDENGSYVSREKAEEELQVYGYAVCQVSGSETDYNAIAQSLAEQYAQCILNRPDWAYGQALDVRVASVEVFDAYYGEDNPNFCFNKLLYVKIAEEQRNFWETGSGLEDPITEGPYVGYYVHGREVNVRKLEDGNWHITGMGTGGAMAELPVRLENATTRQLMDLYFLTAGNTRDWRILYYLGETPVEEVRECLNELDAQRRHALKDALLEYVAANPDYAIWRAKDL